MSLPSAATDGGTGGSGGGGSASTTARHFAHNVTGWIVNCTLAGTAAGAYNIYRLLGKSGTAKKWAKYNAWDSRESEKFWPAASPPLPGQAALSFLQRVGPRVSARAAPSDDGGWGNETALGDTLGFCVDHVDHVDQKAPWSAWSADQGNLVSTGLFLADVDADIDPMAVGLISRSLYRDRRHSRPQIAAKCLPGLPEVAAVLSPSLEGRI